MKDEELYFGLEGNQTIVNVAIQIRLVFLQCSRDFETRKLGCDFLILFYLNYIGHVKVFENNITSLQDKPTDVNVFALSLII